MIRRFLCAFSIFAAAPVLAAEDKAGGPVLDTASIFSWVISTFEILSLIVALAYLLRKTRFVKVNKGTLGLLGVTQNQITYLTDVDDVKLEFEKIMSGADAQTQKSLKENDSTKEH